MKVLDFQLKVLALDETQVKITGLWDTKTILDVCWISENVVNGYRHKGIHITSASSRYSLFKKT